MLKEENFSDSSELGEKREGRRANDVIIVVDDYPSVITIMAILLHA